MSWYGSFRVLLWPFALRESSPTWQIILNSLRYAPHSRKRMCKTVLLFAFKLSIDGRELLKSAGIESSKPAPSFISSSSFNISFSISLKANSRADWFCSCFFPRYKWRNYRQNRMPRGNAKKKINVLSVTIMFIPFANKYECRSVPKTITCMSLEILSWRSFREFHPHQFLWYYSPRAGAFPKEPIPVFEVARNPISMKGK